MREEKSSMFTKNMTMQRDVMPKAKAKGFSSFEREASFKPTAMPRTVENSANPFIHAPVTFPLRAKIAKTATAEVTTLGTIPKKRRDKTIGIPVRSNLRNGSHGNGIFNPENFNE